MTLNEWKEKHPHEYFRLCSTSERGGWILLNQAANCLLPEIYECEIVRTQFAKNESPIHYINYDFLHCCKIERR